MAARSWLAALAIVGAACGRPSLGSSVIPQTPGGRCRAGLSQTSLLVTEWSSSEKANLESVLRSGGGVAVAFSGCDLRLLPECRLPGAYTWQRTTPSSDTLELGSQQELFTKLPLGAASLSGELARSGSLLLVTTISGQRTLVGLSPNEVPYDGPCQGATHIVTGVSLGAFSMTAGGSVEGKASVSVPRFEGGGSAQRSGRLLRSAGDASTCPQATDEAPSLACGSPIQVFLAPIPGRAAEVGPPGTVEVEFVSTHTDVRWDVYVDDQATCTTPCSSWVNPSRPILLRTREDAPDKLRVHNLDTASGPLQVIAQPTARGKLATGIVFTALGGLDLVAGISLAAIGCSTDSDTMCTAGVINIGVGAVVTAGGLWLMLDAMPGLRVVPIFGESSAGVAGSF